MSEYKLTLLYKKGLDYKTRNFIILLCLLALTIVVSVLINKNLKRDFEKINVEKAKLRTELSIISGQLDSDGPLRARLIELREELFLTDTIMPNTNNSTITLSYIFDIFQKFRNSFYFNFRMIGSGQVESDKDVHYNRYNISGSAYVNLLFVFIDQLERQPAFFTIENIELSSSQPESQGKVNFSIELNAYYTKTGTSFDQIPLRDLRERNLIFNLFFPRVYDPFARDDEHDDTLLDITDIIISGFTQDRVFIRNRKTDLLNVLYVDDPIKYGKLNQIDWHSQEVVFRINRTGLPQEIRLPLQHQSITD